MTQGLSAGNRAEWEGRTECFDFRHGFSVAKLVAILSSFLTPKPGDVIVAGTPSGVGFARKPPLFMKHGDVCDVEIEMIGVLSNHVRDREWEPGKHTE